MTIPPTSFPPPASVPAQRSDAELLNDLAFSGGRDALAAIAQRHLPMVYNAAVRQTHDPAMADDVTQAVFLLLLQRAKTLRPGTVLVSWLFHATRYTANDAMRSERRRRHRETRFARNSPSIALPPPGDDGWRDVAPVLDDALAALRPSYRDVILLRYFAGMEPIEIAEALGVGEHAARKRLTRAMEKLRRFFTARHIALPAALPALLLSHGISAPVPEVLKQAILAAPSAAAKALAASTKLSAPVSAVKIGVIATAILGIIFVVAAVLKGIAPSQPRPINIAPTPPPPPLPLRDAPQPELVHDPALASFPIAPGWPRALPGSIYCTPCAADLDGDGKLEILAASMQRQHSVAHSAPTTMPLLYALRSAGSVMPGWPVDLTTVLPSGRASPIGNWMSSPSVAPGSDGKPRIVMAGPQHGMVILGADGRVIVRTFGEDPASSVPIADVDGDGVLDVIGGSVAFTIDGKTLHGLVPAKLMSYAPAIGDADGDGKPEMYRLFWDTPGTDTVKVFGYDHAGKTLPGWPHLVDNPSWHSPVMGDIIGDSKMEIVATYGNHLFAWTYDGEPLPNTTRDGPRNGILVSDVYAGGAPPALADLDGDGKAEIIFFDMKTRTLRAYHGDGRGYPHDDGIIASLPTQCGGVSVVDLDGDGVWDFFTGTWWVKLAKDGTTTLTSLLPIPEDSTSMQPIVTDLDGDGTAEVVFATPSGEVLVYQTKMAIKPQWMQWPTTGGNNRHTGCWTPPK